jgi:hypothetical protein
MMARGDSRSLWHTMNDIMGRSVHRDDIKLNVDDNQISSNCDVAYEFNNYFNEFPRLISRALPRPQNVYLNMVRTIPVSIFMRPTYISY